MTIDAMIEILKRSYTYPEGADITTFVTKMIESDKVIFQREGFAFYVKCSDEMIDKIHANPGFILNTENLIEVFRSQGDNVHFFGIVSTNHSIQPILDGLKALIAKEDPKTVSWWNKDMSRFIQRRFLCHKQRFRI